MAENDVNSDQVVTDPQDANNDQLVTGQDGTADVVNQPGADDAVLDQDKTVPYDRFKEVNDQKKAAEEQAAYAQRQLDLMVANQQIQQPVQQTAPKSASQQALDSLGITADDLYGENIVNYAEAVSQIENNKRQQSQAAINSQQFMGSHTDLNSVVGSVNPATGQIMQATPELLALVQKKPYLTTASLESLYAAVMDERELAEYKKTATVQNEHLNRQNVDTTIQPMGGSAAGGGGAGSQGGQGLMTREQVLEVQKKLAAGEYS